ISKLLSAQIAIFNNFTWNELWTFGDRSAQRADGRARLVRFIRFEAICLAGLVIAIGVLKLGVDRLGLHYQVANAIAIGFATAWNFLVNLRWNWSDAGRHLPASRRVS
ncbi:MAG: GtrA family protein, partial [Candidatus Eisenbacteria bacterium]